MKQLVILVVAGGLVAAGCGASTENRAASGAGIGAGAGAVVGAVTGLSILHGVLLGAVAGGLTGALTDADFLNLGDPIWAEKDRPANASATARVQAGLTRLSYHPGPIDGSWGPDTEAAIKSYQSDHGLKTDGLATVALAQHIEKSVKAA